MGKKDSDKRILNDDAVSSLASSTSGAELALRLSVALAGKGDPTYEDFEVMLCELPRHPSLAKALAEYLASGSQFDTAIAESHYSTDYWLADMMGGECRKADYVRYRALEHFADGGPEWGWRNSSRYTETQKAEYDAGLTAFYTALVDRLTPVHGEIPASVENFKRRHRL